MSAADVECCIYSARSTMHAYNDIFNEQLSASDMMKFIRKHTQVIDEVGKTLHAI